MLVEMFLIIAQQDTVKQIEWDSDWHIMKKYFTSNENNPISLSSSQEKCCRNGYTSVEFSVLATNHISFKKKYWDKSIQSSPSCHDTLAWEAMHSPELTGLLNTEFSRLIWVWQPGEALPCCLLLCHARHQVVHSTTETRLPWATAKQEEERGSFPEWSIHFQST